MNGFSAFYGLAKTDVESLNLERVIFSAGARCIPLQLALQVDQSCNFRATQQYGGADDSTDGGTLMEVQ